MLRTLCAAVAAALVAVAAPTAAAAPRGELVVVANGPSYGTVSLRGALTLDLAKATYQTASPYTLLVATRNGRPLAGVDRQPGSEDERVPLASGRVIPAGRSELRVLTRGATTVRIPVTGLSGRLVVRLGKRLPGAVATLANAPATGNTVAHDIEFFAPAHSLTVQGYFHSLSPATAGRVASICVQGADVEGRCQGGTAATEVGPPEDGVAEYYWPEDGVYGHQRGTVSVVEAGLVSERFTHYVLSLPLG